VRVPWRTSPASKPAPAWAPFSTGPQVLAGACSAWAPHGVTASFRHPPAPVWGPFHGLQVEICSILDLHRLQGDSLPHHSLHQELQGKTLCSDISGTSSPSFCTDLGCLQSCFSHIVSLLSLHCSFITVFFFLFLQYVITQALPPSLIGWALASSGSILAPAGTGYIRHGGSFSQKPPL